MRNEEILGQLAIGASDEKKRMAFANVLGSIDNSERLPAQVFHGSWDAFLFFESDRLFAPSFAFVAAGLLNVEQAEVICLLNFNKSDALSYESAATLFINVRTEPQAYDTLLRKGGPTKGWLFGADRYGGASDRGGWSIYCEKGNDVAVIALRYTNDSEKYIEYLKKLHAEPITTLLKAGSEAPVPFCQMIKPWRHSLAKHY